MSIHPSLLEAIKAITRSAGRDELCQRLVDAGREYAGASLVTLSFYYPKDQLLLVEFAAGHENSALTAALQAVRLNPIGMRFPISARWVHQMYHQQTPVVSDELGQVLVDKLPPAVSAALARAIRFRQYIGMPLAVAGRVVGQMGFFFAETDPHHELDYLTPYADVSAVALKTLHDLLQLQLAARELQAAQQETEAASQSKSQFLANMSHELRTPLNAIMGMTALTLSTDLTKEQREYLMTVSQSAEKLLVLVNAVLDFSRIDTGQLAIEHEPFDLSTVIQEATDRVAGRAVGKGLMYTCTLAPNIPTELVGDADRLRQVLVNLADNAVKFTDEGKVAIHMEAEDVTPDRVTLHATVRDTGVGIPPEQAGRLFRAFAQVDHSMTREFGGAGLGLVISKRLLEMMGGRIWYESIPGVGTTFHFSVPLQRQSEAQRIARDTSPLPPLPEDQDQAEPSAHILLVEDNPVNQRLAAIMLRKRGWAVTLANNGQEALDLHAQYPFDAVLMDVQMPVMDGITATHLMRQREAETGRRTPIIAMTAHATDADRLRSMEAGMDYHLTKPITADELYAVVEQFLIPAEPPPVEEVTERGLQTLLETLGGDRELLREVIELFLDHYPTELTKLTAAVEQQDTPAVRAAAHTLKGEAAQLGLEKARDLAYQLEVMGRDDQLSGAEAALAELQAEMSRAAEAIRQSELLR